MTFTIDRSWPQASTKRLAIVAAMPKELEGFVSGMGSTMTIQSVAMCDFYLGEISGQPGVDVVKPYWQGRSDGDDGNSDRNI